MSIGDVKLLVIDAIPLVSDATRLGTDAIPLVSDATRLGTDAIPLVSDATRLGSDASPLNLIQVQKNKLKKSIFLSLFAHTDNERDKYEYIRKVFKSIHYDISIIIESTFIVKMKLQVLIIVD